VLRALATAIDETVLPAQLAFASEAAGRLELLAGGRRLRSVVAASAELPQADLAGRSLDAEETATIDALMTLLVAFAERVAGPVTVTESRGTESGGRGLSVRRLIELIPASDAAPRQTAATVLRSAADRFLELCGDAASAGLCIDAEGGAEALGDPELEDALIGFLELAPEETAPFLSLWLRQTGRPDGRAFGRAALGDGTSAVLAFPAGAAARVVAAFRASHAD
jgi:hypothetical protein